MTDTPEALTEALRANDARPYGRSRTVTAEELAEAAEQFPDHRELQVLALMDLMEAYEYDGEARKAPVVFARILKLWDTHPDDFNEWARLQVFWRFKWVASALLSTPDVPLDAIRRWHDEMRSRYTAADHGLQPYYAQRYHLAAHTGDAADDAFDLWATRPRSQMSDCTACEVRARARHHAARGDDARALREWQPVLGGESTCSEEPWTSHAWALLPLLREGSTRPAPATSSATAAPAASPAPRARSACTWSSARSPATNPAAWRSSPRTAASSTGTATRWPGWASSSASRCSPPGSPPSATATCPPRPAGRNWTVDALHAHVAAEAEQSAARFDARNGTTAVGDRRRARLARTPLLDRPLALGVRAAGQVPAPAAAPVVRPTAEPVPEDFVALVLRARELDRTDHPDADALWARITTVVADDDHVHPDHPELGPAERLQGNLADHRAQHAFEADDWQTARTELLAAAELYESAGLPIRALVVRTRAAVAHLGEEDSAAPDWPALDEALRRADELAAAAPRTGEGQGGDAAEDRLAVVHSLTFAAYQELVAALPEPPAEVAARFDRLLDAYRTGATELGLPLRIAAARQYAADIAARQGRMAEAREGLETSIEQLERDGLPWRTPARSGCSARSS
ncbi:hypothetical protein ACFQ1I_05650 [Kitasatospora arboriphila]